MDPQQEVGSEAAEKARREGKGPHSGLCSQELATAPSGYLIRQHLPNVEVLREASGCSEDGWSWGGLH